MGFRWKKSFIVTALWAVTPYFAFAQNNTGNKTAYDYVDPLIGTINGGKPFAQ
jgi:hypothetical protein